MHGDSVVVELRGQVAKSFCLVDLGDRTQPARVGSEHLYPLCQLTSLVNIVIPVLAMRKLKHRPIQSVMESPVRRLGVDNQVLASTTGPVSFTVIYNGIVAS